MFSRLAFSSPTANMERTWFSSFVNAEKEPRFCFSLYQCHHWSRIGNHLSPTNPVRVSFEREFCEHLRRVCDVLVFLCDSYIVTRHMIKNDTLIDKELQFQEKYTFPIFKWGKKVESMCGDFQLLARDIKTLLWSPIPSVDGAIAVSKRLCMLMDKLDHKN